MQKINKTFAIIMALMLIATFSFSIMHINAAANPGEVSVKVKPSTSSYTTTGVECTLKCKNAKWIEGHPINCSVVSEIKLKDGVGIGYASCKPPSGTKTKTMKFKYRGVNGSATGPWKTVKVLVPGCVNIKTSSFTKGKKFSLKWDKAQGANKYSVVFYEKDKNGKVINSNDKTVSNKCSSINISPKKNTVKIEVHLRSLGKQADSCRYKVLKAK